MQVIVQSEDAIYSILLSEKISGRYHIYHHKIIIADIFAANDTWILQTVNDFFINQSEHTLILNKEMLITLTNTKKIFILLSIKIQVSLKEFQKYSVTEDFTIGRNETNTIHYPNCYISNHHALFHYDKDVFTLEDINSTNHIYVNRKRYTYGVLQVGDVIDIMELQIIIGLNFLAIYIPSKEITLNTHVFKPYQPDLESSPYYSIHLELRYRSSFIYEPKQIDVKAYEELDLTEDIPIFLKLGPSLMMGLLSICNIVLMFQSRIASSNNVSILPIVLMALSMFVGTVVVPLCLHLYQKRNQKRKLMKHKLDYEQYLIDIQLQINLEKNKEREALLYNFPTLSDVLENDEFWYVRKGDIHYQKLRFAYGTLESSLILRQSDPELTFDLTMVDVPFTIDTRENYLIGIKGSIQKKQDMLVYLMLQIAIEYSYQDIKMVYIGKTLPHEMRWLPHLQFLGYRCVLSEDKDIQDFSNEMMKYILSSKHEISIFVFYQPESLRSCKLIDYVTKHPYCGITLIILDQQIQPYAQVHIDLEKQLCHMKDKRYPIPFCVEEAIDSKDIFYKLYDLYTKDIKQTLELPDSISFLSMFSVECVEELNIWKRWEKHQSYMTLKTPIGIQENRSTVFLDIHEKYHGPHGIMAGTTGSGKSECLLTYLLSLSINYHPEDVSYIIIDYKGGGLAKLMEELPHCAGIITNLDGNVLHRTFLAIQGEIYKRQEILKNTATIFQIANITLNDYQRLYFEQKVDIPLSHLIIVCDEFAELKMQQPMYLDQLISASRIGRSLGIHLVLATQKPNGVINDQIWSNSHFHLCLKVGEKADSMDMIKKPDAAFLKHSGHFYLQIGHDEEFTQGLCAYSQSPYTPDKRKYPNETITAISSTGRIEHEVTLEESKVAPSLSITQLEAILNHINTCANKNNIKAHKLWIPSLLKSKNLIELSKHYEPKRDYVLIGEKDDPIHQCYLGFYMPLHENSIVYGNKDLILFLHAFIQACIYEKEDSMLHLYIIDMQHEIKKSFDNSNMVKILTGSNKNDIHNLFKMMKTEIQNRKIMDSKQQIIIMIYGYTFFEENFMIDFEDLKYILREGIRYRIHVIVTASHENEIKYHMKTYFSYQLVLDMNQKAEVESLMNCRGIGMNYHTGHGYIQEEKVYEVQIAMDIPCEWEEMEDER